MTTQLNLARIAVVLLFAVTFTLIGWLAPVLYASYVPQEDVMEVNSFEAQDTTTSADAHYVCFDRTVHQGTAATTFTELYLLDEGGGRVEVSSETMRNYFQEGQTTVAIPFNLPDNLVAGEYRYLLVVQMEMADGRVTRSFTYQSGPFNITEGPATTNQSVAC